jgi:outer membrane lipoprotein SlyB
MDAVAGAHARTPSDPQCGIPREPGPAIIAVHAGGQERPSVFRRLERPMRKGCSYLTSALLAISLCVLLPASSFAQQGETEVRQGVIEQITETQLSTNHHRGLGAIVGGLGGLGIGSLIGGGTGRDVAMVAGTLGGALFGNNLQKRYDQPIPGQQIIVRVKSGVLVQITQPANPSLRPGQRVYIEGSGEDTRVVPQK